MKAILSAAGALVLLAFALQAADNDKGLPPGLQKKDKLPPGIAKKQGREQEAAPAKPATPDAPAVASPAKPAAPAPAVTSPEKPAAPAPAPVPERTTRELRADIDKRIQAVNTLDDKVAARRAGTRAIMKETGASEKVVQNLRSEFPNLGAGGLLIATEIAAQTKKPAANFVRQQRDGKPWAVIAKEQNVKLDGIEAKLARVEAAMRAAK